MFTCNPAKSLSDYPSYYIGNWESTHDIIENCEYLYLSGLGRNFQAQKYIENKYGGRLSLDNLVELGFMGLKEYFQAEIVYQNGYSQPFLGLDFAISNKDSLKVDNET